MPRKRTTANASRIPSAMTRLHIPAASSAWSLILQAGVFVACTVGTPLSTLLRKGLGLDEAQLRPIDALILDGMPVDDPENAVAPDGARLALAAGLPGIAGLAMKSGSAVRALRAGITHTHGLEANPRPGAILLSLYSLAIPILAGHFLQRGIMAKAAQVLRYARFAPGDHCLFGNAPLTVRDLPQVLSQMPGNGLLFLSVGKLCQK